MYRCLDVYKNIYLFLKKWNPNQNTLAIKKLQPKPEKGCDEKDVKSKGNSQGMLLITLKILIMMTQAAKHFSQAAKHWGKKNVLWPGSSLSKILMWSTAFLHKLWPPPLISHLFHHSLFQVLAATFFTARVFLAGYQLGMDN